MRPWIPIVLSLALGCGPGELTEPDNDWTPNDDGDLDGDGLSNLEEAQVGTDPKDSDSDDDGLSDGREVNELGTNPLSDDTDGDGITDDLEADRLCTDPLLPDTDGDDLGDQREVNGDTDPCDEDSDDDGLNDGEEIETYLTEPNNPDTDGDGLLDGEEINTWKTDPKNTDSDRDGLLDGDEADSLCTDPANADTDGDTLEDGSESEANPYVTDPCKADTDGDTLLDNEEIEIYDTNPELTDSDNDNIDDNVEVDSCTSPILQDTDEDGLNDGVELTPEIDTDPCKLDTDEDGLNDGDEVLTWQTDPNKTDTDGDTLTDGDEVNTHKTNPAKADTDGDLLNDFDELFKWDTNPNNDDSDGEGLNDYDEVITHKTNPRERDTDDDRLDDKDEVDRGLDPNKQDTDGDRLLDGDEVLDYGTKADNQDSDGDGLTDGEEILDFVPPLQPLNPDFDNDGLNDGDEVNVHFTDVRDPDTDDDQLNDGYEVNTDASVGNIYVTDPKKRDTDDGGTIDGQEVLVDSTDPLDGADDVCKLVNVDVTDPTYTPPAPNFDPAWIGVSVEYVNGTNGVTDLIEDLNNDGVRDANEEASAKLTITLLGPEFDTASGCTVEYDMDFNHVTTVDASTWTSNGGTLFEAFTVTPVGGITDCPSLDSTVYGNADIREVLDDIAYGVAIGELGDWANLLETQLPQDGEDWATDYEPFVYGLFVSYDDATANFRGWGYNHDAFCSEVELDAAGERVPQNTVATAPLQDGLRSTTLRFVDPFSEITGIECDLADVTTGVTNWAPDAAAATYAGKTALSMRIAIDAAVTPGGEITDYYWDSDDDGTPEEFGGTLEFQLFEDDPATGDAVYQCSVFYDISDATPIDDPNNTLIIADINGNQAGPLINAWEFTLGDDAESDCEKVPVPDFGTDNIVTYWSGQTMRYGIGFLGDLANQGPTVYGADWDLVQPQVHAEYFTLPYYPTDGVMFEISYGISQNVNDCMVLDPGLTLVPPSGIAGTSSLLGSDAGYSLILF